MQYLAAYHPRQILGIAILASPLVLMAWAWIRLCRKHRSDPPAISWSPSILFLFLMTCSYVLTLLQIFSTKVESFLFPIWHSNDVGIYFLISLLACPMAWIGKGPIRRQVFATGALLTILYFVVGLSMAD